MLKKYLKYITHSVAGMIGVSVYILADTYFISRYAGASGLAALNLILPLYGIMQGLGAMIGIGSATRYTIHKALGKKVDGYFMQSLLWSILVSIPFVLVGALIPQTVLTLLGGDAKLVELGSGYLRVALMGAPFFVCNYTFTAFARNDKASFVAMIASILGSLFNIVFDYVFMFMTPLGFTGAALATVASPIVTMILCMTHFMSKKSTVKLHVGMPSFTHIAGSVKLGVSSLMSEVTASVITFTFNTLLLRISGNTAVAAYGVVANYSIIAVAIFNGISQGSQPLISDSYGNNDAKGVKKYLKYGLVSAALVEVAIVSFVYGATDFLISIFNSQNDMELAKLAYVGMRYYFLGFLVAGINIVLISYYAATAKAFLSMLGSLLRGLCAIILCAVVLSMVLGMNGVWLSFLTAEIITFIVMMIAARVRKK
ncbi:MAG: MATE family efflux transporter [Lachnospiraceae bacterium]|nr:MATE family efflux transporter [Lachnospiraceae bacterium]